jgi:leader peptidase (prepilin peptidase)/N-methyltransferase
MTLLIVLSAVVGLLAGAVLTSIVERVPAKLAVLRPAPRCPGCAAPLGLSETIPVVSWLALRGRCRHCARRIGPVYPVVEALTAALFVGVTLRFGVQPIVLAYWLLAGTLVAVSAIDIEHHIVPNRILYPVLGVSIPLLVGISLGEGTPRALVGAAVGGVVAFAIFFVIHLIQPQGMGFGDVRLAGVIGVYLGWLGVGDVARGLDFVALGLVLGFVLAAVGGLGLMALGRAGRKSRVAFAPFLAVGAMVVVYWGSSIQALWRR